LIWDLKGVPNHIKYSKNKAHAQQLRSEGKAKEKVEVEQAA
jgi:stearoyl-CoA desaturase (Delta-9 desaturase)